MRVESDMPIQSRQGGWLHNAPGRTPLGYVWRHKIPEGLEVADLDNRDHAYRWILNHLPLLDHHREHLTARGMSDEEIRMGAYRTWPNWEALVDLASACETLYGRDVLKIPGFRLVDGRIRLGQGNALAIPMKTWDGRFHAVQLRPDEKREDGAKYVWLSGNNHGGVSPPAMPHVAYPSSAIKCNWNGTAWITEGVIKANMAAERIPGTVIGLPGVSTWQPEILYELLASLQAREVVIAFDADYRDKKEVREALVRLVDTLFEAGFAVHGAIWSNEAGKGLDDVLVNGGEVTITRMLKKGANTWQDRKSASSTRTSKSPRKSFGRASSRATLRRKSSFDSLPTT